MNDDETHEHDRVEAERRRYEERTSRDEQLGRALDLVRESANGGGVASILGALATQVTDADSRKAHELIVTFVDALVFKDPVAVASVRDGYIRHNRCNPTMDSFWIIELTKAIEAAAHLFALDGCSLFPKKEVVAQQLADYIATSFEIKGTTPSPKVLESWISTAVGKPSAITSIVARVIHEGRLFGTRLDYATTLDRVNAALKRRRQAERAQRERVTST